MFKKPIPIMTIYYNVYNIYNIDYYVPRAKTTINLWPYFQS